MNADWKPIETAPQDGTPFLATDGKLRCIVVARKPPEPAWRVSDPEGNHIADVVLQMMRDGEHSLASAGVGTLTHWMPLPPPPTTPPPCGSEGKPK